MKKNNLIIAILLVATVCLTSACGTLKKGGTTLPDNGTTPPTDNNTVAFDPFATIVSKLGNWQTLQTGGNIALKGGNNFSSSIQVRMVRDEAIYISLRPLLGIEVGRLLITADSVYAVDKVHKRYIAEKVSILTAGIPVTVSDVQNIFLGRPFIIGQGTLTEGSKPEVTVSQEGNATILSSKQQYKGYGYSFSFDKSSRITSLDIVPTGSNTAAYQVKYSDVQNTNAGYIAHGINVDATVEKKQMAFALDYKNIDWNGNVKIDRSIPGGYKRMSASSLFSLFSNN